MQKEFVLNLSDEIHLVKEVPFNWYVQIIEDSVLCPWPESVVILHGCRAALNLQ